ncbi:MAG: hypothetical protein C0483_19535 [Pirellula sp.]|nr:hypothetical protein [Pirellula sp.]
MLGVDDTILRDVAEVVAVGAASVRGSASLSVSPSVDQSPDATTSAAAAPPISSIRRRIRCSCGDTSDGMPISSATGSAIYVGGVVALPASAAGFGASFWAGVGRVGLFVVAGSCFVGAVSTGGFQPSGAMICTMPPHRGQARICPMAETCRTLIFARHVMHGTVNSSTTLEFSAANESKFANRRGNPTSFSGRAPSRIPAKAFRFSKPHRRASR